jgi:putative endonuclease
MRGKEAEDAAAEYLQTRGLSVLARNWRCKGGEIDLVCRDGQTLVFVEVRARRSADFGGAGGSITASKRQRLIHAARLYLARENRPPPCRFDALLYDAGQPTWLKDAFQADD